MATHTGAMAVSPRMLDGLLDSVGVVTAETPAEGLDVASVLARVPPVPGDRTAIVTHSGGMAILLADLAERLAVELPPPGEELAAAVGPLLDHGTPANPLDMGGIIGGPGRFAEVIDRFARSEEFDALLAVSTPHPPAHTADRLEALAALDSPIPVVHLWMAGDQAAEGLSRLRRTGAAVSEEPRAAMRAMASLGAPSPTEVAEPLVGPVESWGLPLDMGILVDRPAAAVEAAVQLGYPVVVKAVASGLAHKTDIGGVALDLRRPQEVETAARAVLDAARRSGWPDARIRVQRHRPGLEVIVGALTHPSLGPFVSVGIGGVLTEVTEDVVFRPAPVGPGTAQAMIDRLGGRRLLDGFRGAAPADVGGLASIVSVISRGLVGSGWREVEINPLIWEGNAWLGVDWLFYDQNGAFYAPFWS